ncbi:hypothetical protein [Sansalvadorimonas verongulae]|uniref:hypothetical protein n=1 Tax=Sansalvadorimonas verongulae TaxID=2172824 RepID=UPI0012BB9E0F|nr:hypothetical protein [Sansalvadorimonas verongulae]MTI13985.1 hypothetical protein [Sansalvadorimonas verongulae]
MKILTTLMIAFSLTAPQPDPEWGATTAQGEPVNRTEEMAGFFERGNSAAEFDGKMAEYYSLAIMNHEADMMMLSIAPLIAQARKERAKAAKVAANKCTYLDDASADMKSYFCPESKVDKAKIRQLQHPEFL